MTPQGKAIEAIVMSEINGASSREIGKALDLPASTVRDIINGNCQKWAELRNEAQYLRYAEQTKRQLQTAYSEIAKQSLEQAEKQVRHASYAQALMGAAIATDKVLKLNGEVPPTPRYSTEESQALDTLAAALAANLPKTD